MSKENVEEFKFDKKDYMVLANEADRNYYFTDDKTATKTPEPKINIPKTREELVEIMARKFLNERTK